MGGRVRDAAVLVATLAGVVIAAEAAAGVLLPRFTNSVTVNVHRSLVTHALSFGMRRRGALVVIAHRMSSSLRVTQIVVMDGPHPSVGTHEQLLARNTLYADLHGLWEARA